MDKHSSNVWCLHDLSQIFYAFPKFPGIFSIASFHLHIMYCQLLYIKCQRFYQKRDYTEQNFFQICNRRKSNLHKKLRFHSRIFLQWYRLFSAQYPVFLLSIPPHSHNSLSLSLSLSLNLLKMNEVVSMCLVLHSFMVHVSFPDIDPVYAHEPTEIGWYFLLPIV